MSEADSNPPKRSGVKGQHNGASAGPAASGVTEKPNDPSLGSFLATTRERRGITRDGVVTETRIPAHYIGMIESDNYSAISDQLYLLPFIRRYANFLGLDSDEIAIRFVRDMQRAESSVVRMSEPIVGRRQHRGHLRMWALTALTLALMAAAGVYLRSHWLSASFRPEPAATIEPSPAAAAAEKRGEPIVIAPSAASAPPSGTNPAPPRPRTPASAPP
jgi:cytoskeletal protein RodZ